MDVQPAIQASLPDSRNKINARSSTPLYLATSRSSLQENACLVRADGNEVAAYQTAQMEARMAQKRNNWGIVNRPSMLAATRGMLRAPTPKKMPSRFNMGPRCAR